MLARNKKSQIQDRKLENQSIHQRQHFASDLLGLGAAVAEDALGRAQDLDAHAAENGLQVLVAHVLAAARLAHAIDLGDQPLAVGAVFQVETDRKSVG